MYDVIETLNAHPYTVRVLERDKTKENADAILKMAIARRGIDKRFYSIVPAGKYQDGENWLERQPR